jgi:hypothetical protein
MAGRTFVFPFVIPSEAEGSAVLSATSPLFCGSATLPFVVPSEAEGSAVLQPLATVL